LIVHAKIYLPDGIMTSEVSKCQAKASSLGNMIR